MKANPGGALAPSEVVGRDRLIQKLWRALERQSLVLTAERRMGKTTVVKKMQVEAPERTLAIYQDLEKSKTALGFAQQVYDDVERHLSRTQKSAERVKGFLKQLSGTEIGGVVKFPEVAAAHWQELLQRTIEDLLEHQSHRVIFFWDELPLMLYDINKEQGDTTAQEILDVLRSLRSTHSNLRMVFTGSIGLHNVLTDLKRSGYANDPTNDMKTVDVPPLDQPDAEQLALRLLIGEDIQVPDQEETAHQIATAVDCLPYFVHQIVDHLACEVDDLQQVNIDEIVKQYLLDSQDPWHLEYYRDRIQTYYEKQEQDWALKLLDALAITAQPQSFDDLYTLLLVSEPEAEREAVRDVLKLLQRDHYVIQKEIDAYQFRFSIIQQSWIVHRGLTK